MLVKPLIGSKEWGDYWDDSEGELWNGVRVFLVEPISEVVEQLADGPANEETILEALKSLRRRVAEFGSWVGRFAPSE